MYIPDRHKAASTIVDSMSAAPDMQDEDLEEVGEDDDIEAFAHDLIDAIKSGDAGGVASALKAIFMALDSAPHDEGGE